MPESLNWRLACVLKYVASAGIVKVTSTVESWAATLKTGLTNPARILIYTPEGTAITEYQLLKLPFWRSSSNRFGTAASACFDTSHATLERGRGADRFDFRDARPSGGEVAIGNDTAFHQYRVSVQSGRCAGRSSVCRTYCYLRLSGGIDTLPRSIHGNQCHFSVSGLEGHRAQGSDTNLSRTTISTCPRAS